MVSISAETVEYPVLDALTVNSFGMFVGVMLATAYVDPASMVTLFSTAAVLVDEDDRFTTISEFAGTGLPAAFCSWTNTRSYVRLSASMVSGALIPSL